MTDPAMLPRRCAVPLVVLTLLGVGGAPVLAQESLPVELQVRLAVQAAPEGLREDATVQGWNPDGTTTVIRPGTNELVCLGPNPARDDFEALSNGNPLFHESRPEPVGILSAICQQH